MDSCPQCKELVICSESRLVQDSCGHIKCRMCLLSDSTQCLLCWQKSEGGTLELNVPPPLVNKNDDDSVIPNYIEVILGNPVLYKCVYCNEQFQLKSNCLFHKNCKLKTPYCDICDKKFANKSHLDYHKLTHEGVQPYKCTVCTKGFKSKSKLNRHLKIHSGSKKQWICNVCSKAFSKKESLKRHSRRHFGSKKFQCDLCQKLFLENTDLLKHQITHSDAKNFVCENCGKSFKRKYDLSIHVKDHQYLRRHVCKFCDKIFFKFNSLKRHMRKHDAPQKFECFDCNSLFSRKDNLERHIRSVHLEETTEMTTAKYTKEFQKKTVHVKPNDEFRLSRENKPILPLSNRVSVIQRVPAIVRASTSIINDLNLSKDNDGVINNNNTLLINDNKIKDVIFKQPFPVKSLSNGHSGSSLKRKF